MSQRVVCVIPARLESTRLPRKLLLAETGQPLILHTVAAAQACDRFAEVVVATDSDEIHKAVGDACRVIRTGPRSCGTDRIAIASFQIDADLLVNLQGDEPEIQTAHLAAVIDTCHTIPGCDMATLAARMASASPSGQQEIVKVHTSGGGFATAFIRAASWSAGEWQHVGVYAYSPRFVRWFSRQPISERERTRSLEQMRALDSDCRIRVTLVDHPHRGIDTRADYDAFLARHREPAHA